MFMGTSYYTNNTSLFITDVGDVDSNNVLCMTDLAGCCTNPGRGQWIYIQMALLQQMATRWLEIFLVVTTSSGQEGP